MRKGKLDREMAARMEFVGHKYEAREREEGRDESIGWVQTSKVEEEIEGIHLIIIICWLASSHFSNYLRNLIQI
jgi:hypothetical protein